MQHKIPHIIIFALFLTLQCTLPAQDSYTVTYISLDPYYFHLEYLIDSTSILIDVREFFEYRHARIKDAVHIPTSKGFDAAADTIGMERSLFLYCYNDFRSRTAAEFFISKGYTKVYNLEGGIIRWRRDNMPVDRSRVRRRR